MKEAPKIELITNINEAEKLWNTLSPKKSIDDEWNFRFTFYKYLDFKLHFLAGFSGSEVIGLLPLQLNTNTGLLPPYCTTKGPFLEFFGGDDTDDNGLLIKKGYEEYAALFLNAIDTTTYMAPLKSPVIYKNPADFYENKYVLPLDSLKNGMDYIDTYWHGKSKYNLKKSIKRIYADYSISVSYNDYADLEYLFYFNKKRFGDNSSFIYSYRQQIFKDLIHLYPVETISLRLNGNVEAFSYAIFYKNTYISMNVGVNSEIENLGKFLNVIQIDRALQLGSELFDAGKGDNGWKESFKFSKIPQYQFFVN